MPRPQFSLKTLLWLMGTWLLVASMLKAGGFNWGSLYVFAFIALLLAVARWAARH